MNKSNYWCDKDYELLCEASKSNPDFERMEAMIRDGANVNAISNDKEGCMLSEVIFGLENVDLCEELPQNDSLPEVIRFFLKHGFDPSLDEGRFGAKCLYNLTWSPCVRSKVPAMKCLLEAGCRNIPSTNDEREIPEECTPIFAIGGEASFLRTCEKEFEESNTFEALYQMLLAKDEGRPYIGVQNYDYAYGMRIKDILLTEEVAVPLFFDLNLPNSCHRNCFKGELCLVLDGGYLYMPAMAYLYFDEQPPLCPATSASDRFADIIGSKLTSVTFASNVIQDGSTYHGQTIMRFSCDNGAVLTTQDNFGEVPKKDTIAYYAITKA